jgi:phosphoribosylaminoimidazolecarboxamide formyltransferase/IMP cyclohydrolase
MAQDLKKAYRTIMDDHFPEKMEVSFVEGGRRQTLVYEKVSWIIDDVRKGLRYGENPGQEAALYKLVGGNLVLGDIRTIEPGRYLASGMEMIQQGKHPGKINITDADAALGILRYLDEKPCVVIVKHNNPCGVACGGSIEEAYRRAFMADRVAAFGGAIGLNRPVDKATAEAIYQQYAEVVVAPEYEEGALQILTKHKNLRIMKLENIRRLAEWAPLRFLDLKSLVDGAVIAQVSFVPEARKKEHLRIAEVDFEGKTYRVKREPAEAEYRDMIFGWMVESGVTSNSVIYVKDECTVGIGTGEQDRVGVAEIARDKAYRKLADRISWERWRTPLGELKDEGRKREAEEEAKEKRGGIPGSVMVSDAFFPFRDGVDVGLREGVKAVVQPGGSMRDHEAIEACNEYGATMVFTGQRSFKH